MTKMVLRTLLFYSVIFFSAFFHTVLDCDNAVVDFPLPSDLLQGQVIFSLMLASTCHVFVFLEQSVFEKTKTNFQRIIWFICTQFTKVFHSKLHQAHFPKIIWRNEPSSNSREHFTTIESESNVLLLCLNNSHIVFVSY